MSQIFNIFPTTVYVGEMSDHDNYKKSFYDVYHKFDYEETEYNNTVSENTGNPNIIHLEDSLEPIFDEIISHVKKYTCEVLGYKDLFNYMITKSWLSRHTSESREIPWHIHATSHISFCYYLNMPPKAHKLKFSNPHNKNSLWFGNKEGKYDNLQMIEKYNERNAETFFIDPPEGHVVLFPSSLMHSTESIEGFEGERLAIIGDLTIVLKEHLLGFSTGYIHPQYWKIY